MWADSWSRTRLTTMTGLIPVIPGTSPIPETSPIPHRLARQHLTGHQSTPSHHATTVDRYWTHRRRIRALPDSRHSPTSTAMHPGDPSRTPFSAAMISPWSLGNSPLLHLASIPSSAAPAVTAPAIRWETSSSPASSQGLPWYSPTLAPVPLVTQHMRRPNPSPSGDFPPMTHR